MIILTLFLFDTHEHCDNIITVTFDLVSYLVILVKEKGSNDFFPLFNVSLSLKRDMKIIEFKKYYGSLFFLLLKHAYDYD